MNVTEMVTRVVPTLKCNNRKHALAFFKDNLGMNILLEDGAWTSLGDASKIEKLTLEEAPSNRTRAVKGTKKLAKLIIKVAVASEIEALLARGASYTQLYQGQVGYAFEALSPEGDLILLHAEESLEKLNTISFASFEDQPSFTGLTAFEVEQVQLHVPDVVASQTFYGQFVPGLPQLAFLPAEGTDLQVPAEETWDISQLKFILADFDGQALKAVLPDAFLAKSGKFLTIDDPSQIEVWFEGL